MTEAPLGGHLAAQPPDADRPAAPIRARILLHSAIQLAGRGGNAAGAIVVLGVLTRYLGRSGYGTYAFVAAYVSFFYVVVDAGTQAVAVRDMARSPRDAGLIASQLLTLKALLAIVALALAIGIAFLAPSHSFSSAGVRTGVIVAGAGLIAAPLMGSAQAVFQLKLRMTIPALADVTTRYVSLALLAGLAGGLALRGLGPADRIDAALAAVTVGVFAGSVLAYARASRVVPLRLAYQRPLARRMFLDAMPVALVTGLGLVHYRIDIVLLSLVSTRGNVALYSVATKVLDVALAGLAVYMGLVFPVLSRLAVEDRNLLREAFQRTLDFILIVGLAAALAVTVLAPLLVRAVTTAAFAGATQPLIIIAWAIPITFVETLFSQMIIAANRQLRALPALAAATIVNIVLNLWLIPHLGPSAPALVTDISETIAGLGLLAVLSASYGFRPSLPSALKILTAAAAAGAILHLAAGLPLPVGLAAAALVDAGLLWQFGVVTLRDARALVRR